MFSEILIFLFFIGVIVCDTCYNSFSYPYYTYCSGYCSGIYGREHCDYNGDYVISGGGIAGLIIGVLVAGAIVVVIVVVCIKGGCNKGRPGRVMTTTGGGVGTHVAVTTTSHNTDEVLCGTCYKYSSSYGPYTTYCSGYCSGYYGSQYCYYYYYNYGDYVISGGAIAGLVIGVLASGAIFVVIVVICIKGGCNKGRPGRVMTTTGGGVGTHVAITNTSHNPGYMQPMNQYGYSAPSAPPANGMMYPPAQQASPAYPQTPGVQQGYGAPAQSQYSSVYNQPVFGNLPRANM